MFHVSLRTTSRRLAGLVVALLTACLAALLLAPPAAAAAGSLVVSDPDDREQVDDAPGAVNLVFSGKVDDGVAKVLVLDSSGANVTSGPLIVEGTNVATTLRDDLPKGTYTVHYRVNGTGGEPRGGAFQFSYGAGAFTDLPDRSWSGTAQEPEILRGDDPNGPPDNDTPGTETPGIEVTSSGTEEPPPPATTQASATDDPDDPGTGTTQAGQDPSKATTASAVPAEGSGAGRVFLVGGIILLAAVGGTVYGVYHSRRKGAHS